MLNENNTQTELPGEELAKEPPFIPAQYSTWMQTPEKGAVKYLVVIRKTMQAGRVKELELLRLFEPELASITPEVFYNLMQSGKMVEWKM